MWLKQLFLICMIKLFDVYLFGFTLKFEVNFKCFCKYFEIESLALLRDGKTK